MSVHMKRLIDHNPELYGLDTVLHAISRDRIGCGRYADMVKRVKVDTDKGKVVIRDDRSASE